MEWKGTKEWRGGDSGWPVMGKGGRNQWTAREAECTSLPNPGEPWPVPEE